MSVLDAPPPPPPRLDSLDDLRAYLWRQHQVTVDASDPILMLHTIHRVALDEYRRMLDQHNRAVSEACAAAGQALMADMRAAIEEFRAEALSDAVRSRLATLAEAERLAQETAGRARRHLRATAILVTLNYLAIACTVGVLAVIAL